MSIYKPHIDLANERYQAAVEQLDNEKDHLATHLFINAAINYHNALCQKFLNKIPRNKPHSDTSYFSELSKFLGADFEDYRQAYQFLMAHKSQADYGITIPPTMVKQIHRRTRKIKDIIEHLL